MKGFFRHTSFHFFVVIKYHYAEYSRQKAPGLA